MAVVLYQPDPFADALLSYWQGRMTGRQQRIAEKKAAEAADQGYGGLGAGVGTAVGAIAGYALAVPTGGLSLIPAVGGGIAGAAGGSLTGAAIGAQVGGALGGTIGTLAKPPGAAYGKSAAANQIGGYLGQGVQGVIGTLKEQRDKRQARAERLEDYALQHQYGVQRDQARHDIATYGQPLTDYASGFLDSGDYGGGAESIAPQSGGIQRTQGSSVGSWYGAGGSAGQPIAYEAAPVLDPSAQGNALRDQIDQSLMATGQFAPGYTRAQIEQISRLQNAVGEMANSPNVDPDTRRAAFAQAEKKMRELTRPRMVPKPPDPPKLAQHLSDQSGNVYRDPVAKRAIYALPDGKFIDAAYEPQEDVIPRIQGENDAAYRLRTGTVEHNGTIMQLDKPNGKLVPLEGQDGDAGAWKYFQTRLPKLMEPTYGGENGDTLIEPDPKAAQKQVVEEYKAIQAAIDEIENPPDIGPVHGGSPFEHARDEVNTFLERNDVDPDKWTEEAVNQARPNAEVLLQAIVADQASTGRTLNDEERGRLTLIRDIVKWDKDTAGVKKAAAVLSDPKKQDEAFAMEADFQKSVRSLPDAEGKWQWITLPDKPEEKPKKKR